MGLSERQQKIYEFINKFMRDKGRPPTIREIGGHVGISSTSVVNYNLNILAREGLIQREKEVSRGLRVVGQQAKALLRVLQQNVTQYETAFGEIKLEPQSADGIVQ